MNFRRLKRAAAAALFCCALVGDFGGGEKVGNRRGELLFRFSLEVALETKDGLFKAVPHEGSGGDGKHEADEDDGEISECAVRSHLSSRRPMRTKTRMWIM